MRFADELLQQYVLKPADAANRRIADILDRHDWIPKIPKIIMAAGVALFLIGVAASVYVGYHPTHASWTDSESAWDQDTAKAAAAEYKQRAVTLDRYAQEEKKKSSLVGGAPLASQEALAADLQRAAAGYYSEAARVTRIDQDGLYPKRVLKPLDRLSNCLGIGCYTILGVLCYWFVVGVLEFAVGVALILLQAVAYCITVYQKRSVAAAPPPGS